MKKYFLAIIFLNASIPHSFADEIAYGDVGDKRIFLKGLSKKICISETDEKEKGDALATLRVARSELCDCISNEISHSLDSEEKNNMIINYLFETNFGRNPDKAIITDKNAMEIYYQRYKNAKNYCLNKLMNQ